MAWVKLFKKPGASSIGRAYQPGSMSSLALTKGLLNEPGQNSCFLNSAVQVLWQLDIFRRSLRQLPGHFCLGDACIFCALKSIFTQFQHSRERALPSDSLRLALAETFKDEQRFQLGFMGDAAECFENILERIHLHIVSDTGMEVCTSKSCITHQKFAMTLYEQSVCWSCGASCDPLPFTELVHYVSTTALCQQVERMLEKSERLRSDMFGELLKAASTIGDLRKCPSDCGQSMGIRRVLMNSPEIVTIGFVWDAEQSDLTEEVIRSLGPHLNLSGLFCRVMDEGARRSELLLVGMVCYSSRHYCAFAFHTKSARWVFFDDATVKEIGSKWKDVVAKCIRGHFQPLLLFYANPDGMPVSNEDAPRQTTLWSRQKPSINGDAAGPDLDPWVRRTEVSRENSSQGPFRHKQQASGSWGNGPSSATRGPAKPMTTSPRSRLREPIRENGPKPPEVRTPHPQRRELTRGQRRQDFRDGAAYAERRTRSASPPETVHQTKTLNRMERTSHYSRPAQEPRPHSCRKQESLCQSEAGAPRSRARTWRPVREVLNVDSVLSELERRQQSPRRKACTHQRVPRERERERPRAREERRPKSLMTIYEDEQRQESGRHSSLESEGREGQLRGSVRVRGANWTIQRTESGYESSDRLSNGSTNPDSPIVENFVAKELRPVTEGHFPRSTPMPTRPVDSSLEVSPSSPAGGENQSKTERKDFNCQDVPVPKPSPCLRGTSRAPLRSPERGSGSDGDPAQQDVTDRGYLTGSPALQALGKTSSSEWNSSDDLMGPLSEQEDSAYRSSNSETAPTPVPVQGVGVSPLPIRKCSQRQTFRPRLLQEPSQTSPRPSAKALDAPAGTSGQGVSLTTYFSVDHCMTDTYRLKYHHRRPRDSGRSLSAESLSPSDLPRSRQETGYSTSRQTIKWNPVTPRGLDEHGFL